MRTRLSISLHEEDLIRLESLQNRLETEDLMFLPQTSEVVRLALLILSQSTGATIKEATKQLPEYRAGRPKKNACV